MKYGSVPVYIHQLFMMIYEMNASKHNKPTASGGKKAAPDPPRSPL